ncbi:MAG TPA: class I SAM-dependent methyltransferase [Kofleriaceae bacterium]|nr:class I SAM-dependent methyltransferase [Kofleriaceae bacterium]
MLTREDCFTYWDFVDRYQSYVFPLLGARMTRMIGRVDSSAHLIDMGTGPGYLSVELAARTGAIVHAVDINPAMHEIALSVAEERGQTASIRFDREDVHQLSYASGFAAAVVSYSCFHHWAQPVRAMAEIWRVLAPGGHLILLDTNPLGREFLAAMSRIVVEREYFRFIEEAIHESLPRSAVAEIARAAGLTGFSIDEFEFDDEDLLECAEELERAPILEDLPQERVCWSLTARKPLP